MKQVDPSTLNTIFVRVPNWVGDCVMCIPALRAIKQIAPQAKISVIGRPWVADLFERMPEVHEVIAFDKKKDHGFIKGFWQFCKGLKAKKPDAFILFQNAFEAGLMSFLAKSKYRVGYNRDGRGLLLTHPLPVDWKNIKTEHEVYYYLNIIKQIWPQAESLSSAINLPGKDNNQQFQPVLDKFNIKSRPIISFAPSAAFGPAKKWPIEFFASLSKSLKERYNATIVILGTQSDLPSTNDIDGINLCGKTSLGEMVDVIAGSDYVVTNDSGPMHVAAGLNIPLTAIFGSTDPIRTGPFSKHAIVLQDENLSCRPCRERTCRLGTYECLTNITCDKVLKSIEGRLDI